MRVLTPCFLVNTEYFPTFQCLPICWAWNGTAWFHIEFPWWIMKLKIFHIGLVWSSLKCLLMSFPIFFFPFGNLSFPCPLRNSFNILDTNHLLASIKNFKIHLTVQVVPNGNVSKLCPVEIYSPRASILSKKMYFSQISKLLGDRKGSKQLVGGFCEQEICLALKPWCEMGPEILQLEIISSKPCWGEEAFPELWYSLWHSLGRQIGTGVSLCRQ